MLLESPYERELYEAHKARRLRQALAAWKPKPKREITIGPQADEHVKQWKARDHVYVPNPTIRRIVNVVCETYCVTPTDIVSQRRTLNVILPRQVAMYLSATITTRSLPEIGRCLGGKHHTSIMNGVRKIERLMESSPALRAKVEELRNIILNGSTRKEEPPCAP